MKAVKLTFFLIFIFCSISLAQNNIDSDRFLNGKSWRKFLPAQKSAYILGFYDFINFVNDSTFYIDSGEKRIVSEEQVGMVLHSLTDYQANVSYQEVISYLDTFYQNETNLNIPVLFAYNLFIREFKGQIVEDEKQKAISNLRKEFNE